MQRPAREDFVALLFTAAEGLVGELRARMSDAGYGDIREAHGCVFGNIAPEGMRLTDLAEHAGMTKQGVGEAVTDLERLGYAERVPDPNLTTRLSGFETTGLSTNQISDRFERPQLEMRRKLQQAATPHALDQP